jgi:hypothetical protein
MRVFFCCVVGWREGKEKGAVRVEVLYGQGHGSIELRGCSEAFGNIMLD